jgi:crossover junction endodeoxyribonuclease RuvC
MVILGIDPSLRGTGWGVVELNSTQPKASGFGTIRNQASISQAECLVKIRHAIHEVITKFRPDVVAVEGLIYVQNVRTALILGQARGAAILAAAEHGLEIFEYAPRRVKQSVVGIGGAKKNQVGFMIRALLELTTTPEPDAADALAIALTHANSRPKASPSKL